MMLKQLDAANIDLNVVIMQTTSDKLRMFVQDKVKRRYGVNADTIVDCHSKKDYKDLKGIIHVLPPFSGKWYVDVDLDACNDKEFIGIVREASTCVFFCNVSKYRNYKVFKDSLKKKDGVVDFYISFLRKDDMVYLYDAFVPAARRLTKDLFDYVSGSYSSDVESVMDLFLAMAGGAELKSRKDISDICGLGGNSAETFAIAMLKSPPATPNGIKKVLRNRVRAGSELGVSYGWPQFYRRLKGVLVSFIQLKMLVMSGAVYKRVRKLPEGYDARLVGKGQRYLYRLAEVPLSRVLRLYSFMQGGQWRRDADFLAFVYGYMQAAITEEAVV